MDKYYLMYKDTPVISFGNHFEELTILDTAYLPYGLRNRRIETTISSWLADRATPITRDNAEFLYMVLGKSRSPSAQRSTMLEFGGVSVNDFFWIKRVEESVTWAEVSPFTGSFKWSENDRAFGYGMLSGTASDALRPYRFSPEVTLQGIWSKCLVRKIDGVYIYKANDGDLREVEISKFGQMLGLDIVKYWAEDYEDVPCTVCKILSSESYQWITAEEIGEDEASAKYPEQFAAMQTFDYIIANPDRHAKNWGWVVDCELNPIKLTPLYDFNFALHSSISMEMPDVLDAKLVERAKSFLDSHINCSNRELYLSRIKELTE